MTPSLVFPAAPARSLPTEEDGVLFPVRRIYCVGRNYAAHVRELGGDPKDQPPVFFMKPYDAAWSDRSVPYPPATRALHHEIELVIAIGREGAEVSEAEALGLVWGYAAGVDLTRRDLQAEAKAKGQPWDSGKGFDASAPIGPIRAGSHPPSGLIRLRVNGETRQTAPLSDMIFAPNEIIAALSRLWRLMPGDLVFTGTPEGVGPLERGDQVEGLVADLPPLEFTVV